MQGSDIFKLFHQIQKLLQIQVKADLLQKKFCTLPLRGKAGNSPYFDLDPCVELLVPHVPHTLNWGCYCFVLKKPERHIQISEFNHKVSKTNVKFIRTGSYPSTIENWRCLKDPTIDLSHLVSYQNSKLTHIRIGVEVGTSHLLQAI